LIYPHPTYTSIYSPSFKFFKLSVVSVKKRVIRGIILLLMKENGENYLIQRRLKNLFNEWELKELN